jgi:hypothetical protein
MMAQGFFFGGLELIFPLLAVALVVAAMAALAAGRRDPDPSGQRPLAVYLFSITFVSMFLALFAAFGVVSSLARIALGEEQKAVPYIEGGGQTCVSLPDGSVKCRPGSGGVPGGAVAPETELQPEAPLVYQDVYDPDREAVREAVQWALVAVAGGVVLAFHGRRAIALADDPAFAAGPAGRTYLVYVYAVCFVAVLVILGAAVSAAYGVFRIAAPGYTGFGGAGVERDAGIQQLISSLFLGGGSLAIFAYHWRRATGARPSPPAEPTVP